jgi:ATP-binding cassette subfamily B protein
LRSKVSIVFQDYARYDRTAYVNVALGAPHLFQNKEKVIESAEKAGAVNLVAGLKDGYEQMLGRRFDDGVDLSGGQWQRLATLNCTSWTSQRLPSTQQRNTN